MRSVMIGKPACLLRLTRDGISAFVFHVYIACMDYIHGLDLDFGKRHRVSVFLYMPWTTKQDTSATNYRLLIRIQAATQADWFRAWRQQKKKDKTIIPSSSGQCLYNFYNGSCVLEGNLLGFYHLTSTGTVFFSLSIRISNKQIVGSVVIVSIGK